MVIQIKKSYTQTPSKIRFLWEIAHKLIGSYEDFDRRLIDVEKKVTDLSYKIAKLTNRVKNA